MEERRERFLEAALDDVNGCVNGGGGKVGVGMSAHVMDEIDMAMGMLSLEPGCGVVDLSDVDVNGCLTFKEMVE